MGARPCASTVVDVAFVLAGVFDIRVVQVKEGIRKRVDNKVRESRLHTTAQLATRCTVGIRSTVMLTRCPLTYLIEEDTNCTFLHQRIDSLNKVE
jgi:hypothetical protein